MGRQTEAKNKHVGQRFYDLPDIPQTKQAFIFTDTANAKNSVAIVHCLYIMLSIIACSNIIVNPSLKSLRI
jgi:hypothetical protein